MAKKGSAPAVDPLAEIDSALTEAESTGASPQTANASAQAIRYAEDFGVDLKEVKGSGLGHKITVPDVEAFVKEREAKAEVEKAKAEAGPTEEAPTAPADPKGAKKSAKKIEPRPLAAITNLLPSLRTNMKEVRHIVRTLNEYGIDWGQQIVSAPDADENLSALLEQGWALIHVQSLGVVPDGIQMLWVLGMPTEEAAPNWPYREIHHIVRQVGSFGEDGRGVTGYMADSMIAGYLEAGWNLAYVHALAMSTAGINMMWVLIR
jgi:hypothetical protein